MPTAGRISLFLIVFLGTVGLSLGQTETVEVPPDPQPTRPPSNTPVGIRAGYTNWENVNQFHTGVHVYLGELWPNIEFTPNLEVGFGDDAFIMTLNGDLTYLFSEFVRYPWGLYGGGSLSFNLVDPKDGKTATDLGLSVLLGTRYTFANNHIGMFEIKAGVIDSPGIKLTFGYTLF